MKKCMLPILALLLVVAPWTGTRGQTQGDLNVQTTTGFQEADEELNSVYRQILEDYAEDDIFIANLKEAQRCWIAFRDAQLKMKFPDREPGYYGSVLPMCEATYLTELTQDRIKALRVWLEGLEEGNVCTGTVKVKE